MWLPVRTAVREQLGPSTSTFPGTRRLTVLCAPSGYGKTDIVAGWLGDGSDPRQGVRWVSGRRSTSDAVWHSLTQELAPLSSSAPSAGDDPRRATLRIAASITSPLTVVVDDYHQLTSPENDAAIAELSAISPLLRVVVVSRRVTLLDRPLIAAKLRVLHLGERQLALTPDETQAFAASLGVPPGDRLRIALGRTDGWPLAIGAALELGSDELYLDTTEGRRWIGSSRATAFDPVANLTAFALDSVEVLSRQPRTVILAATQLDALGTSQAAQLLGSGSDAALAVAEQLVELGLLVRGAGSHAVEFRCHRALQQSLHNLAVHTLGRTEVARLHRVRAKDLEPTAPGSAFRLYCAAGDYEAAERVLALNFAVLADDADGERTRLLRAMPDEVLLAHPTLTFALLFVELPLTDVAPERIEHLVRLWAQALRGRLPQGSATPVGPLHFPLLCQEMAVCRVVGDPEDSHALMRQLESQLAPSQFDDEPTTVPELTAGAESTPLAGFLPVYFHLAASTAITAGDLEGARRNLNLLRRRCEQMIIGGDSTHPGGSRRTVADAGTRWLLAALSGLAFADLLDGDLRGCADVLAEFDELAQRTGAQAPSISWVGAEIARAHLSYELADEALLDAATSRLSSLALRLDSWPLLLIAQAAWIRRARTTCSALTHLRAGTVQVGELPQRARRWSEFVLGFEISLSTCLGDLPTAAALLATASTDSPGMRLEQARFALFSGDDVQALLTAQYLALPGTTKRQRIDRFLISAVAAWNRGRREDAFFMLREAATLLELHQLPSALQNVPYLPLRDVAVAAREAGVCDLVGLVDQVPEPARAKRYERLTGMELRTLRAIAEHGNANNAAAELFITPGTVKKHLASIYRKLGVNGRDEAILMAGRMGLLA
ncbi:MAG: LuxR C-terminal-related transcriptional regulator [Micropruina sp.]